MVTAASSWFGPPAGSRREGCGAKSAGTPLWHAAAAKPTSSAAVSLEELKVITHDQGEGADGARGQRGKGRVAVDGPAQLGEGKGVDEAVFEADREHCPRI